MSYKNLQAEIYKTLTTKYEAFKNIDEVPTTSVTETTSEDDEWIWIDAFKGTNKDMMCLDMQYKLGTVYEFDGEVEVCAKGYHCCKDLDDVFHYYNIGNGNRYFRVRALVHSTHYKMGYSPNSKYMLWGESNKFVAKKIEFISEIEDDELFKTKKASRCVKGEKYYKVAREQGLEEAHKDYLKDEIIAKGYPNEVAEYLRKHCCVHELERAIVVADAPFMSLDTKYVIIFNS